MITREIAQLFADEWEQAWNTHDIDQITQHYAKDIVLVSPVAEKLLGNSQVQGIEAVKNYFLKGLEAYPDLKFKILDVLYASESIVLYYVNQNGIKAGEFMQLDANRQVLRMYAHYSA